MNYIKRVRKIGLWLIVGVTLATLLVLNVIQETSFLNVVVLIALAALVVWLVVTAVISCVVTRKSRTE